MTHRKPKTKWNIANSLTRPVTLPSVGLTTLRPILARQSRYRLTLFLSAVKAETTKR